MDLWDDDAALTPEEDRRRAVHRAFVIGRAVGVQQRDDLALDGWRPRRAGDHGARLEASEAIVEAFRSFIERVVTASIDDVMARLRVHEFVAQGNQPSPDVEAAYRLGYDAGRLHPDADIVPLRLCDNI